MLRAGFRWVVLLPVLPVLLTGGCMFRSTLRGAEAPAPGGELLNVKYFDGEGFDEKKHRLDVYKPKGEGPFPVLVFVHGGGWFFGDRQQFFEPYEKLGRRLAAAGVIAVVVSYRLAPEHKHPKAVEDVAAAFAHVFERAAQWGGDPERIFGMGHSAGAHLLALAASDPSYLLARGHRPSEFRGVVPISGPYDVSHLGRSVVTAFPMVRPAFGDDAAKWELACPAHYVKKFAPPPMLLAYADGDPDLLRKDAHRFYEQLLSAGREVVLFEAPFDDHFSEITDFGLTDNKLTQTVLQFIREGQLPKLPRPPAPSQLDEVPL